MIAPLHIVGRADVNAVAGVVGAQRAVLVVEERIEVEVEDRFAVRQLRDGRIALVDDLVFEVGAIRLFLRGVEAVSYTHLDVYKRQSFRRLSTGILTRSELREEKTAALQPFSFSFSGIVQICQIFLFFALGFGDVFKFSIEDTDQLELSINSPDCQLLVAGRLVALAGNDGVRQLGEDDLRRGVHKAAGAQMSAEQMCIRDRRY